MGKNQESVVENDLDLVEIVREMLVDAGLENQVEDAYDDHRLILAAIRRDPDTQRQLLNRFWAMQIHSCHDKDSLPLMSLVPDGSVRNWISMFKNDVLPFVTRNRLPVRI